MSKLNKVTIEGIVYLGTLVKNEDNTFTLKRAHAVSNNNLPQSVFVDYLRAKNVNELQTVDFGGNGQSYTISKLTKDQKLDLKVVKLTMQRAKALAAANAENDLLGELLGK